MADSKISGLVPANAAIHQEIPVGNVGSTLRFKGDAPIVARSEATFITPPGVGSDGAKTRRVSLESVLDLIGAPGVPKLRISQGPLTDPVSGLEHTVTWNDAADTFTAWKLNVTNTNSAAASLLLDLQVGGATQFKIRKDGQVTLTDGTAAAPSVRWSGGSGFFARGGNTISWTTDVALLPFEFRSVGITILADAGLLQFCQDTSTSADVILQRPDQLVLRLSAASDGSAGASFELREMTAPSAPAANFVRLYAQDNGAGKTQLMARFATGAAQQVAIEP